MLIEGAVWKLGIVEGWNDTGSKLGVNPPTRRVVSSPISSSILTVILVGMDMPENVGSGAFFLSSLLLMTGLLLIPVSTEFFL